MAQALTAGRALSRDGYLRLSPGRLVIANGILAIAYAAFGVLAFLLVRETGVSAPVWPSAGIALAAVFLRGPWLLPGVFVGSFLASLPEVLNGQSIADSALLWVELSLASVAGAYVGATLARRAVGPRPALSRAADILRFLILAALVGAAVSAALGTAVQAAAGLIPASGAPLAFLTWWVGDALGITVFAPLCLTLAPEQMDHWRGRRLAIALPSLLVLAGLTTAIVQNASLVEEQRSTAFRQEASDAAAALEREVLLNEQVLESIVSHQESAPFTRASTFRTFTEAFLVQHPELLATSWNPIVPAAQRASFTEAQRYPGGLPGYEIVERDAAGQLVPAAARAEYVPVGFIEPAATNARALGFDINSEPIRADAISRARTTGTTQLTAPIDLVQTSEPEVGALMIVPAVHEDGEVVGFAVGTWRLGSLLTATLDGTRWRDWNFELTDVTPGQAPRVIATSRVDASTMPPPADLAMSEPIAVGGRLWSLTAWPGAAVLSIQPPATSPFLLIAALLIAFLLEAFLLLVTGLERRARKEADDSGFDAAHDELTGLLNRRGFFRALQSVRERTGRDGTTSALVYLDLDGFKAVNDNAGHDVGDALLRAVGAGISGVLRERDVVARLGGDEFAIIANNCSLERGSAIAHAISRSVDATKVDHDGAAFGVRASIGLALIEGPEVPEMDDLMRRADGACYQAKRAGGDAIVVATAP